MCVYLRKQCVSVLQCQGACLWLYEGGAHAQMCLCLLAAEARTYTNPHTYRLHTQMHAVVHVHQLRKIVLH